MAGGQLVKPWAAVAAVQRTGELPTHRDVHHKAHGVEVIEGRQGPPVVAGRAAWPPQLVIQLAL